MKNFIYVALIVPKYLISIEIKGPVVILTTTVDFFYNLILFLKKNIFFRCLILTDIAVVDHNKMDNRFEINYIFLSVKLNQRVIVRFFVNENVAVESLTNLFSVSSWMEREVWDLYGIYFKNHADLRRILTDYGFKGFPLRKDFPLNGFFELRYDDEKKHLVYESIELTQEMRVFDFLSAYNTEVKT